MTTEPRRLAEQLLKDQVAIVSGASQGIGQAHDLVGCAIFLASSLSDWMTGEALLIDGGATLW